MSRRMAGVGAAGDYAPGGSGRECAESINWNFARVARCDRRRRKGDTSYRISVWIEGAVTDSMRRPSLHGSWHRVRGSPR